jgi:hypothetical protein
MPRFLPGMLQRSFGRGIHAKFLAIIGARREHVRSSISRILSSDTASAPISPTIGRIHPTRMILNTILTQIRYFRLA